MFGDYTITISYIVVLTTYMRTVISSGFRDLWYISAQIRRVASIVLRQIKKSRDYVYGST